MVKRSILIGSLSGPYFAIRTTKMDRSRTDFIDLCFIKDVQRKHFILRTATPNVCAFPQYLNGWNS